MRVLGGSQPPHAGAEGLKARARRERFLVDFSSIFRRRFSVVFGCFRGLLEAPGGPRRLPRGSQGSPGMFDLSICRRFFGGGRRRRETQGAVTLAPLRSRQGSPRKSPQGPLVARHGRRTRTYTHRRRRPRIRGLGVWAPTRRTDDASTMSDVDKLGLQIRAASPMHRRSGAVRGPRLLRPHAGGLEQRGPMI